MSPGLATVRTHVDFPAAGAPVTMMRATVASLLVPYSSRELVACVPSVCSRHPALAVGEGLAVRLGAPVWLHSDFLLGNFPGR